MGQGLLHVTILSAKDLPKQERFGKQPCYCEVQLGKSTTRSKVCKDGGQCPAWNETMFLQLDSEQHITFTVFVERLLMKDVEVGTGTYSLDHVIQAGTDEAQLRLSCGGRRQGTLSINLELRSTGGSQARSGSSGSSLASPLSSSSLAVSHSGSLGGSFTGIPGLKASSLPIMLQQQPNLALYREQLLQQSALLTQKGQQQQQWTQQGRHSAGTPTNAGSSSSTSAGAAAAGTSRLPQWAPKRTAADLFTDPSSIDDVSALPHDLLGMFGAADSSFSGFDSVATPHAPAAVDALRVQALVDAVYGSTTTNQAGPSTVHATAAAAGSRTAGVADVMQYGVMMGGRTGLWPPISDNISVGQMGSITGGSQLAGVSAAGGQSIGLGRRRTGTGAAGAASSQGRSVAGPTFDGRAFDPFQAAASQAAAAAAGDLQQCASSGLEALHHSSLRGPPGQQPNTAAAGAAADQYLPQAFSMAAIQAAAAVFAAEAGGSVLAANETGSEGGHRDAFLRSAARPPQPQSPTAGAAASSMPDPFGFGVAAAAAAAAGALPGRSLPEQPTQQAAARAAAAAAAAHAGSSSSSRADGQHLPGGGAWGVPRKWSAVSALQPVAEVSESFLSGGLKSVEAPGAAATAEAQLLAPLVLQDLAEVSSSPGAVDNSQLQALLCQSQQQVALLTEELKERNLLVQHLEKQLLETRRQVQSGRGNGGR